MRDGWIETSLGDVAEWWSGGTPKAREPKYYENGTIPWAVIADMNRGVIDSTNSHITEEALEVIGGRMAPVGSVLISMYASVGKSAIANIPLATNQAIAWGIPDQTRILPFYLFLVSQQLEKEISNLARGATQKNINRQMLREFTFQLPPLPEQRRIVDLMSEIDSYIEALQQRLESATRSRVAAVHDKLARDVSHWTETRLIDVATVLDRYRRPINSEERELRKGSVPYYGANGQTGWIDDYIFDEELVLLGEDAIDFVDPNARKAYIISGPSWVNNHAHVLRADSEKVLTNILAELLNLVDYTQYVSFGTRSKLTQASMNEIRLLIPSLSEQKQISGLIQALDTSIVAANRTIDQTRKLRSALLAQLLSGEHEIPQDYDRVMSVF